MVLYDKHPTVMQAPEYRQFPLSSCVGPGSGLRFLGTTAVDSRYVPRGGYAAGYPPCLLLQCHVLCCSPPSSLWRCLAACTESGWQSQLRNFCVGSQLPAAKT